MKYVKSKIVMLPTEKASKIVLRANELNYYEHDVQARMKFGGVNQYLYFLSDEEIKEDDWYLITGKSFYRLMQNLDGKMGSIIRDDESMRRRAKKIIATTDKSLRNYRGWTLARPSNEFLKKYCKLGGIKEVLVEYEYNHDDTVPYPKTVEGEMWKLKVAPDNTITTKLIKDSWNRDEIKAILLQFAKDCGMNEDLYSHYNGDYKGLDNWIEENL